MQFCWEVRQAAEGPLEPCKRCVLMEGWTYSLHSLEINVTRSYYERVDFQSKENLSIYLSPSHGPCSHGRDEGHVRVIPLQSVRKEVTASSLLSPSTDTINLLCLTLSLAEEVRPVSVSQTRLHVDYSMDMHKDYFTTTTTTLGVSPCNAHWHTSNLGVFQHHLQIRTKPGVTSMAQSKYQTIPDHFHAQNQKMPVACR